MTTPAVSPAQWFQAAEQGDVRALERWHERGALKKQRFEADRVNALPGQGRPSLARLLNPKGQTALDVALEKDQADYAIRLLELERFAPREMPKDLFQPQQLAGQIKASEDTLGVSTLPRPLES